jgi:Putative Actinobacterial Holin-X, holin superfamily III
MADHRADNIQTLLGDALRDSTDLARKELALFKAEMAENVRGLAIGLAMFVAAAVFAIICISLLTQSLVEWLATKVNSEALASLIVAVIMGAIAGGLIMYGKSKLSATSLAPDRTIKSVRRDAEVLTERVSTS